MKKVLRVLTANVVNDKNLKDTLLINSKKDGKLYFFETLMSELVKEKIHGVCLVIGDKKFAAYSESEVRKIMKENGVEECVVNVIPMKELEKY